MAKELVVKYPVEYKLEPENVDRGTHWVTLSLKNIGDRTLRNIDVKLHSLDSYAVDVYGTGQFLSNLKPREEEVIPYQVSARATTQLYASLEGREDGDYFYYESPEMTVKVGREAAELETLFALTHPYTSLGKTIEVEAKIKGLERSEGLRLELWAKTPGERYEELANIKTKELAAGEEARYSAEITPKETGMYTVNAYLYDGNRRIGRKTEYVWVQRR